MFQKVLEKFIHKWDFIFEKIFLYLFIHLFIIKEKNYFYQCLFVYLFFVFCDKRSFQHINSFVLVCSFTKALRMKSLLVTVSSALWWHVTLLGVMFYHSFEVLFLNNNSLLAPANFHLH